ncbi:DUF4856 domain-containing protein [Marinilongibacter aquaticus]|uniref:DUF4856 domain-containing protein n=1 Tax=Marinilongibacter aquaticus TaxID=2975157 RepID=UPI0021BD549B|nr:DUF4856 domain-containing protein [Marinilongibacter aquaticus]UBM57939.1 DUF4856 domain-containing protein [Marinilongibacter aquaticus]
MRKKLQSILLVAGLCTVLSACENSNENPEPVQVEMPENYSFQRNGTSTVNFSGQTERIRMAMELNTALKANETATASSLLEMFRNQTAEGGDADPFEDAALNAASKSIKEKVASSKDYFSANASESAILKGYFESWLTAQATEVFPNWNELATAGKAGQVADGTSVRYVGTQGYEYNQLVAKGLIGALMLDQIVNNYLSTAVLDEGTNREDNSQAIVVEGEQYTNMEHKWDEAYGYLFGNSATPENPDLSAGGRDDSFLNNYLRTVESDDDFSGITQEVYDAFKLGRAAIVAGDYSLRDAQADIIKENLSKVVAIRAVHYLLEGKEKIEQDNRSGAFHALSEGVGFAFSLRFTKNPSTNAPHLPSAEVAAFAQELFKGNGLWDVSPELLGQIASRISSEFGFTEEQAKD